MTVQALAQASRYLLRGGLILALVTMSCKRPEAVPPADTQPATAPEDESADNGGPKTTRYPAGLSATSTPTDVAQRLLEALAEKDRPTLEALVAPKAALAAMRDLLAVQDLGATLTQQEAIDMTMESWLHKYSLFKPGSAQVVAEHSESENAALVSVRGQDAHSGAAYLLVIPLLRDRRLWHVGPDLQFEREPAE